jgi:NADH:ubiquinone oxidoreductase subunit E
VEASGKVGSGMVVGGGIAGMQAALDMAACGRKVFIVYKKPGIGGVMAQLDKTFPTNDCAMCTMAPRLVEIGRHKDIELITLAEMESIEGVPGNFTVTVKKKPRYVDESKCTGCGTCVATCPVTSFARPLPEEARVKPELNQEFRDRVIEIVQRNKGKEGPIMPILQEINALIHYFPEDVLDYVAQITGYPLSHLFKLATFYGAFSIKPRGKYSINVCTGTACYVRGVERILDRFSQELGISVGETTQDRLFTLKTVRCLGCCGLAPVLTVGEDVYGKINLGDVPKIPKKYKENHIERPI